MLRYHLFMKRVQIAITLWMMFLKINSGNEEVLLKIVASI